MEIQKLSKNYVKIYLIVCKAALTKPQYEKSKDEVLGYINTILSELANMYSYRYYNETFLNKNDLLVVFLSSVISAYIVPMGQILIFLARAYGEGKNGPANKCFSSLRSLLRSNFNLMFQQESRVDDILSQVEQICLKSTLDVIVRRLNTIFSFLAKFKV